MTSSEIPLNEIKLPNDYKPSEDEEFMNPLQLAYFRKKLFSFILMQFQVQYYRKNYIHSYSCNFKCDI